MRISVEKSGSFVPLDETFNKHIVFRSGGINGNISYTGAAQWTIGAQTVKLYDLISEAVAEAAAADLKFGPLTLALLEKLKSALSHTALQRVRHLLEFELHITGYQEQIPFPFVAVVSTYRKTAPWIAAADFEKEWEFDGIKLYLKLAEEPDVIFGGADHVLNSNEKRAIFDAANRGADAFNMSKFAARLVERASSRTALVGPKSVSVLLPKEGLLDTNLWKQTATGIEAFVPRIAFQNGTMMGPSTFPVDMTLLISGHLPKQSLFFKSIVSSNFKKSARRRIFRQRKGKRIPGIMGLLMLGLFGAIPDEYEDFGLL
jgi:hypothetical protein